MSDKHTDVPNTNPDNDPPCDSVHSKGILSQKMRRVYVFIGLLFLAYLYYWHGLSFTFWKDDWYYLWSSLYEPRTILTFWLHPGTTVEFLVLSKLFGQQVVLWQHFGILLKALAALSVFDMTLALFGVHTMAILSAIVFVTLPIGMESVNWPSAHVTIVETMVFCEATAWVLRKRVLICGGQLGCMW